MDLSLILSIISFLIAIISILMSLNDITSKKSQESIFKYVMDCIQSIIEYMFNLITAITKAFSDGILKGVTGSIKIILESLTNLSQNLMNIMIHIVRFTFSKGMADLISKMIYLVLFLSTMWASYFLYMGLINPKNVDYYSSVSGMIVSVATMFSILVGFYEFRKK